MPTGSAVCFSDHLPMLHAVYLLLAIYGAVFGGRAGPLQGVIELSSLFWWIVEAWAGPDVASSPLGGARRGT